MYVEEFRAEGPLTAGIAEDLAVIPGVTRSAITISSNGRSVHAPVLPWCWDVLRIDSGDLVTVTTAHGLGDEDRLAIRRFVDRFQALTGGATPSRTPGARSSAGKRALRVLGRSGRAAVPRGSRPS
ncbi:hypothetical protein IFM12275_51710 [Nocardia sputorum]|uniref:Uncharacterized protein n=2 Tax=Nocardiaceae TaxID=85025 RepID=A0ABM8D2M2_9NOCA|nr:hypothetical protein IFM12275_51710 [Nocardia sputorum]BDU01546.1 hypothetical protein IFM12276_45740 [Nocardia sputorum]